MSAPTVNFMFEATMPLGSCVARAGYMAANISAAQGRFDDGCRAGSLINKIGAGKAVSYRDLVRLAGLLPGTMTYAAEAVCLDQDQLRVACNAGMEVHRFLDAFGERLEHAFVQLVGEKEARRWACMFTEAVQAKPRMATVPVDLAGVPPAGRA